MSSETCMNDAPAACASASRMHGSIPILSTSLMVKTFASSSCRSFRSPSSSERTPTSASFPDSTAGSGQPSRRNASPASPSAAASTMPCTFPLGDVSGMVLAAALGLAGDAFRRDGWPLPAVESGKLALVGVRSLDDGERELLGTIDAKVFTMSDVDRLGVEPCMREALAHASGGAFLHVSFDMD